MAQSNLRKAMSETSLDLVLRGAAVAAGSGAGIAGKVLANERMRREAGTIALSVARTASRFDANRRLDAVTLIGVLAFSKKTWSNTGSGRDFAGRLLLLR
jgi:hypothetical protein